MKIKKDDLVKILLGKDLGKTGKILRVFTKENKILVEGINVYKRHVRKMNNSKGGIVDISKPIDISNAALVCPKCKKETRVGYKTVGTEKARFCKKCQEIITGH